MAAAKKGISMPKNINWNLVLLIVFVVIIYFFWGSIKRTIKGIVSFDGGGGSAEQEKVSEEAIGRPNMWKLSKSKEELNRRTNNIFQAMDRYGTDEDVVIEGLSDLNIEDIKYIQQKFGVKSYNGFGLSDWADKIIGLNTPLNMNDWIKRELGGSDLEQVKQIYSDAGLTF